MVGQTTTAGASAHTRSSGASVVSRLSLDELAGQRVIYAYSGLQPPANLLALIREGEAAGVIFFAPNIGNLAQFRTVVDRLQRASLDSALHAPLLMLVDQEGGLVRRLPGAPLQSEKQIGASSDAAGLARDAGRGAGLNLRSVGLNVNLAPVLDVYRQPGNFIDQFQRSYSNNPATTGALGAAFISSQQSIGIGATAKHFPGLGAATHNQNTDLGPVVLDLGRSTLRSVDEYPFRQAIHAGVKLIMLSWATYPALDPKLPAGLSPSIISGELRTRLGFRGVTITDGIDAGAVTPFGSLGTRSLRAAVAGADLILCAATNPNDNSPSIGLSALHALASALADHRLSQTSAEQAAARILALREHQ
jgi:beta-N-acetylhexosaminidase